MIFSIFIVIIFAFLMIKKNYMNQYSWLFAFSFLSLSIIMFAMILYINKNSMYRSFFRMENDIYFLLQGIKLGFYDIYNIVKFGVMLLIVSKLAFLYSGIKVFGSHIRKAVYISLISVPCILYYYCNSFDTIEKLFRMSHRDEHMMFAQKVINMISLYNLILLSISFIIPYALLFYRVMHTKIEFKKKQFRMISAAMLVLDLFLCIFFIAEPFRSILNNNSLFHSMIEFKREYVYIYTTIPVVAFVIFVIVYAILIKYDILNGFSSLSKWKINKNVKLIPQDIRCVAHSLKNSLFSVSILNSKLNELYGMKEGEAVLKDMTDAVAESMRQVERLSNIVAEPFLNIDIVSVLECVDMAKQRIIAPYIDLQTVYDENTYILADGDLITEALENILHNAVEAIDGKSMSGGKIVISVYHDDESVCISIWDNGGGIPNNIRKKMFKPFFSTKNTHKNWGIGLSYANDIIKAHLGKIILKSSIGKFTEFQILFPILKI